MQAINEFDSLVNSMMVFTSYDLIVELNYMVVYVKQFWRSY